MSVAETSPSAKLDDLVPPKPEDDLPTALHLKTLLVSRLPDDATSREIHLLFSGIAGYATFVLKEAKNGKKVGFVTFDSHDNAKSAKNLLKGVSFDPENSKPITVEFASGQTDLMSVEIPPSQKSYFFSSSGTPQNLTTSQKQVLRDPTASTFLSLNHILRVATTVGEKSMTVNEMAASFVHFSQLMLAKELKVNGKTVFFDAKHVEESRSESQRTTLFVGNISSTFDKDRFRKDCQALSGFITLHLDKNVAGNSIAFVNFSTEKTAQEAKSLISGDRRYAKTKRGLRVEYALNDMTKKESVIDKDLNNNSI